MSRIGGLGKMESPAKDGDVDKGDIRGNSNMAAHKAFFSKWRMTIGALLVALVTGLAGLWAMSFFAPSPFGGGMEYALWFVTCIALMAAAGYSRMDSETASFVLPGPKEGVEIAPGHRVISGTAHRGTAADK